VYLVLCECLPSEMESYLHSVLSIMVHRINTSNDQLMVSALSNCLAKVMECITEAGHSKIEENIFMAIRIIFDNLYSSNRMLTHFGLATSLAKII